MLFLCRAVVFSGSGKIIFSPAGDIWQCVETFLVVATRGSTRYYWIGVKDATPHSPTIKNFQAKISIELKLKNPHI